MAKKKKRVVVKRRRDVNPNGVTLSKDKITHQEAARRRDAARFRNSKTEEEKEARKPKATPSTLKKHIDEEAMKKSDARLDSSTAAIRRKDLPLAAEKARKKAKEAKEFRERRSRSQGHKADNLPVSIRRKIKVKKKNRPKK